MGWYANGAKRYKAGTWPKKQFDWFDKATSVYHFETRQTPAPTYVGDCQGCPSTGGPGQTGSASEPGVLAKANGAGEAALVRARTTKLASTNQRSRWFVDAGSWFRRL